MSDVIEIYTTPKRFLNCVANVFAAIDPLIAQLRRMIDAEVGATQRRSDVCLALGIAIAEAMWDKSEFAPLVFASVAKALEDDEDNEVDARMARAKHGLLTFLASIVVGAALARLAEQHDGEGGEA